MITAKETRKKTDNFIWNAVIDQLKEVNGYIRGASKKGSYYVTINNTHLKDQTLSALKKAGYGIRYHGPYPVIYW